MHAESLVETWLECNAPFIHRSRMRCLVGAVGGLLRAGTLTLTKVGRALRGSAKTKHKIKRIDRLLANPRLAEERRDIYKCLSAWLLNAVERPVLIVDWSDCEPGHEWLMLTAALAVRGRALTIYEEVHPLRRYNSPRTHRRFLRNLAELIPFSCRPIIVTDAGFRGPWFRDVESLGWDWVGRVRNRVKVLAPNGPRWRYASAIYREATHRIRYLGHCQLSRKRPYAAHLYLAKVSRRGPGRPLKSHGRGRSARRCRKLYNDPWLLATSLPHQGDSARRLMKLYAKRMQIEETFRDLKSERAGFGFELARTRSTERRQALLLIATLTMLALWLVGLAAKARQWEARFQANTVTSRPVLSIVYLAREVLRNPHLRLTTTDLRWAFEQLQLLLRSQANPV